jgi:hypothetical protein
VKIRDLIDVVPQPTVVRLDQLDENGSSSWITESYYITEETERHFRSLKSLLRKKYGCGMFLIGHYGSGKSHFLAYVTQQVRYGGFSPRKPDVVPISLLNYKANRTLESIVEESVGATPTESDRRIAWDELDKRHSNGLMIVLDELSEFLRSKPSQSSFNEDIRFLQFLGEWSQNHALWVLAALQEQIEHAGDIEYDLFRKIKDRYPIRYILTPTHIKSLIAGKILQKKPGYQRAVEELAKELKEIFPHSSINFADFCEVYPIHPATLELLEQVRDRFSQARGIVDFTLTRLLGDEARGIAPFLDEPWGHLISPDLIVDHFLDLLEVQPEFQAIAQRVLPYYRKNMSLLFDKPLQRELSWRLLKLLVLVYLSPSRKSLAPQEAGEWLLFKLSALDPQKNLEVIERALERMTKEGAYLRREGSRYRLDVEDDSKQNLDRLLARTVEELRDRGDSIFETLISSAEREVFNPFSLPRDRWQTRTVRWHFHEREVHFYFGGGRPPDHGGTAMQIGLPWGPLAAGTEDFKLLPKPIEMSPEILELAALIQLKDRPLAARVLKRVEERIAGRSSWFWTLIRSAYTDVSLITPAGATIAAPLNSKPTSLDSWLSTYGEWMLRQTYPQFERFAPGHGPLPREGYRQFMKHAVEQDLCSEQAPEFVKLIREAYLVPMGLMQRRGLEYSMNAKLDQHELVTLLMPVLEHHPSLSRVYDHLSGPVYGLVPDQIHLLLITLLVMGEIDIIKGGKSYRESYETLSNPIQYDKIVPGRALNANQLRDLQTLAEGLGVRVPKQWSVLAQRRAIEQLKKEGIRQRDSASAFLVKLKSHGDAGDLPTEIERFIEQWLALEKGESELQGFQHFLYTINSPRAFLIQAKELATLPDRFEKLLRETQRFSHLFGYPCVSHGANTDVAVRLEALGPPPSLADPERLEYWLGQARDLYQEYKNWYRGEHDAWWQRIRQHVIWAYQKPDVARSRHLSLDDLRVEVDALQAKARNEICTDIASLEFQPLCRCGFDGSTSPIAETLTRFDAARRNLEGGISMFFAQDQVKSRVRTWVEQGLEMNAQTLSYLDGEASYPQVDNMGLFDQHLSGLELVHSIDAESVLEMLAGRTLERHDVARIMDRLFERFGARLSIQRVQREPRRSLTAWCLEQALRSASTLPQAFSAEERNLMIELIQPDWVSKASLGRLEELGLPDEAVNRVLEMVLDGRVSAPLGGIYAGPVQAAAAVLRPNEPASPQEFVERIALLYSQHHRLAEVCPKEWLVRLNEMANIDLSGEPEGLIDLLENNLERQWVLIDCFGAPLLDAVKESVKACFGHWRLVEVSYGLVSLETNTDAFYQSLIRKGVQKPLEKIDAVDSLIHGRRCSPRELVQLARTELEIAMNRLVHRLDPEKPVLVFGDHGFRLTADGKAFSHGGPSTLERLVPVLKLEPY